MRQTSFREFHCSLSRSLEVMGDWWTPLILRDVYLGIDRFDDLVTDLGISRNLLTTRLAAMVADGVLARVPYSEHPPRFHYRLTDSSQELVPILLALTAWGDRWQTPPGGPPLLVEHAPSSGAAHRCQPVIVCDRCSQPLHAGELRPLPGPGGRAAPGTALVGKMLRGRTRSNRSGGR